MSAAITSVSEVVASCDAFRDQLLAQLLDVRQVAVVPEGHRPGAAVLDDRLCVRPVRRAGRRVARVADRDLALEAAQVLLVEDLGDEAHVAQDGQAAAVGDGDARGLLPAVLEGEQAEVRDARDVALGGANAEDTAHLGVVACLPHRRPLPQVLDDGEPSESIAAAPGRPRRAAGPTDTEGAPRRSDARRSCEDRPAAAFAEERSASSCRSSSAPMPAAIAASASAIARPPSADVVDERAARRDLVERRGSARPLARGRAGLGGLPSSP